MYTSCVLPYCAVWSTNHAVPFCHMTHYITVLVAITVWKTNSQEIFPNAAGALKKHVTCAPWEVYTFGHRYTCISSVHYLKSGYVVQLHVIAF